MTSREPSYSIHVAAVYLVDRFTGGRPVGPEDLDPRDPESILFWANIIKLSWSLLGAACLVVMGVATVAVGLLVGNGPVDYVVTVGAGATFFCLAGCPNTLYRRYAFLPEARRLAQRGEQEASQALLRRSLPSNGSLVLQAAVGILAAVITAVNA